MNITMVSLEDGITSCGFRKISASVRQLNPNTEAYYISTNRYRTIRNAIGGGMGSGSTLTDDELELAAEGLVGADLVGFSSMTGYSELTRKLISRLRRRDPKAFIIWGGIHPIIHPEDAITADVDAICTGEGEFAFEELYERLQSGKDYSQLSNFWVKRDGKVIRNGFLPLMSTDQMESLPFPLYAEGEKIFRPGIGFAPMRRRDYVDNDGIGYTTLWSIGCPFHCTYCGNTKFIENDPKYKKIRHPSARYIVDEVKAVMERSPHISQVSFHDDSFMAIPYRDLEEFSDLWRSEVGLPFAVYGVIPNYVKRDKFELLTWAGMNRIRMGIQSGSQEILDFYKRPTPPARILEAGSVIASFSPEYHIPPAYDVITDNPIETRQDVVDTLELLYAMDRPYTLLIYALKVIPNTGLERAFQERGVDLDSIDSSYAIIPPRLGNLLLYVLAIGRPPRKLFDILLRRVEGSATPQKMYPKLGLILRTLYLSKRTLSHFRHMDFSVFPGMTGFVAWRVGLVGFWRRRMTARPPRPARHAAAETIEVAVAEGSSMVTLTRKPREAG